MLGFNVCVFCQNDSCLHAYAEPLVHDLLGEINVAKYLNHQWLFAYLPYLEFDIRVNESRYFLHLFQLLLIKKSQIFNFSQKLKRSFRCYQGQRLNIFLQVHDKLKDISVYFLKRVGLVWFYICHSRLLLL